MSLIKSFSVGNGDMFYIKHNSDSFTIIDCCLSDENKENIVKDILRESKDKSIIRFISTHPDDDHIRGLKYLDERLKGIRNFYCVKNKAIKDETDDFKKYCELRNGQKTFLEKGLYPESPGIKILWPVTNNTEFKNALEQAKKGNVNNISPIIMYSLEDGVKVIWMGDLENDFLEKIKDELYLPKADIVFAPHHGRKSGTIPKKLLDKLNPKLIIIGEAPSEKLNYYNDYKKTITQNSAGDIIFKCITGKVHIYVSNKNYKVDFLTRENIKNQNYNYYIGTLNL